MQDDIVNPIDDGIDAGLAGVAIDPDGNGPVGQSDEDKELSSEVSAAEPASGDDSGGEADEGDARSPLQKFMEENGLSEEQALTLLGVRQEESEAEQVQAQEAQLHERADQMYQERFAKDFNRGLDQYMSDPRFRQAVLQKLARYEPGLGQSPDPNEQVDPVLREVRELRAQNQALYRHLQGLDQRVQSGAERQLQEYNYHSAVASNFDRFMSRFPAAADYVDELQSDLEDAGRRMAFRDPRNPLEVTRFLAGRLQKYQAMRNRWGAQPSKKTRPPQDISAGTPGGARTNPDEPTDLSTPGIAAAVLEEMRRSRG